MTTMYLCGETVRSLAECAPYQPAPAAPTWAAWKWPLLALCLIAALWALILLRASVRIVMEYERAVVFRLGRLRGVRGPGLVFLIPWVDWATKMSMRVQTQEIADQRMISSDGVALDLAAVIFYRTKDPAAALTKIYDPAKAVGNFSLATLRSIVGEHTLDQILSARQTIADRARQILDEITERWGVEIERVEIKDIGLSEEMERAMSQEAEAVREKRARVTKAEGEAEAATKLAEAAASMSPGAMELRRLQTYAEIGAEHNSTIIVALPTELMAAARALTGSGTARSIK